MIMCWDLAAGGGRLLMTCDLISWLKRQPGRLPNRNKLALSELPRRPLRQSLGTDCPFYCIPAVNSIGRLEEGSR